MISAWKECATPTGFRYRKWIPAEMPRIPDDYADSIVYLYQSAADVEKNNADGCGMLAGVAFKDNPNRAHVYLVSASHVAENCRVARYNTLHGPRAVDLTASRWLQHREGADISVFPLESSAYFDERMTMIRSTSFMTQKRMGKIPLRHGDELFMVSHFASHPGDADNEPIIRFGTLTKRYPVRVAVENAQDQESFLAEMISVPGHSGSPVFVYFHGTQARLGTDMQVPKPGIYLLGLHAGCYLERQPVRKPDGEAVASELYVNSNSGIAYVIPAWKAAEILNYGELKRARRQAEHVLTRSHPRAFPATQHRRSSEGRPG